MEIWQRLWLRRLPQTLGMRWRKLRPMPTRTLTWQQPLVPLLTASRWSIFLSKLGMLGYVFFPSSSCIFGVRWNVIMEFAYCQLESSLNFIGSVFIWVWVIKKVTIFCCKAHTNHRNEQGRPCWSFPIEGVDESVWATELLVLFYEFP